MEIFLSEDHFKFLVQNFCLKYIKIVCQDSALGI